MESATTIESVTVEFVETTSAPQLAESVITIGSVAVEFVVTTSAPQLVESVITIGSVVVEFAETTSAQGIRNWKVTDGLKSGPLKGLMILSTIPVIAPEAPVAE